MTKAETDCHEYSGLHNYQIYRIVFPLFPFPSFLLPAPCSLLPAPCSLLPAPCSLLPKNQNSVPIKI
ncbi:hypothetical protein [Moorena sp. SIO3H5]|uniref:hypothetical protein n=1 Tax=Moorena sp. SIO3H5 TaxID=2607834 RepID=UPI0013BA5A43|nr:hypothetical protein [Moorena sp. SIO3H5]NEO68968.1 hypothetical protein [Moorena sp. SIO3H5]